MKRVILKYRIRGISMIEVLITVLLLSIGMFGLAKLQGYLYQSGTFARERANGVKLAQQKLDDLRSFWGYEPTIAASPTPGVYYYNQIGNDTGGLLNQASPSNLLITSGAKSLDNVDYRLHWGSTVDGNGKRVTVYVAWLDSEAQRAGSTVTLPSTLAEALTYCAAHPSYCVQLQSMIYPFDPTETANSTLTSVERLQPFVGYVPIGVPDAVPVTINVGSKTKRESTSPLPELFNTGDSIRTTFETVDYADRSATSTPNYQTVRRTQWATVTCNCAQGASEEYGYAPAYYYWNKDAGEIDIKTYSDTDVFNNATGLVQPNVDGTYGDGYPDAMIAKRVGIADDTGGSSNNMDPLCSSCCRDHHDATGPGVSVPDPGVSTPQYALYDPDRPTSDYLTDTDHKHYAYTTGGGFTAADAADAAYLESCRFVRADGYWQIFQDWRLSDIVSMPKDNYLQIGTQLAEYQSYLYANVSNIVTADGQSSFTTPTPVSKSGMSNRFLQMVSAGTQSKLMGRGLYVDRVYTSQYDGRTKDDVSVEGGFYKTVVDKMGVQSETDQDWLELVPFNEVNLAMLSSWRTSDSTLVTVSNDEIKTVSSTVADAYGVYTRGLATGGTPEGTGYVTVYALPSNSGLTGGTERTVPSGIANSGTQAPNPIPYPSLIGIDPSDHIEDNVASSSAPTGSPSTHNPSSFNRKFDTIEVRRQGLGISLNGLVKAGNIGALTAGSNLVGIQVTAAGTCLQAVISDTTGGYISFGCAVSSGYNQDLTVNVTAAGTYYISTGTATTPSYDWLNYRSYASSPVTASVLNQNFWVFGTVARVNVRVELNDGCDTGSKSAREACRNAVVNAMTLKASGSPLIQCGTSGFNEPTGSLPATAIYTCDVPLGSPTTYTWAGTVTAATTIPSSGFAKVTPGGNCTGGSTTPYASQSFTVGPRDMTSDVTPFKFCMNAPATYP